MTSNYGYDQWYYDHIELNNNIIIFLVKHNQGSVINNQLSANLRYWLHLEVQDFIKIILIQEEIKLQLFDRYKTQEHECS